MREINVINKASNQLYLGDNLQVLKKFLPTESVDLIYLDPPFASNSDYGYLFPSDDGLSTHRITAFTDIWTWSNLTVEVLEEIKALAPELGSLLSAFSTALKFNGLAAYLVMMSIRLVELKRVLKRSGSLYLHCDSSASSYLKVILDLIFGSECFRSEIAWKRTSSHNDSKKWAHIHDTLLFYAGKGFTWNPVFLAHDPEYVRKFYRFEDKQGRYRLHEIIRTASMGPRPNLAYEYKGYTPEWGWRMIREKLEALDAADRIVWSSNGRPYVKKYLDEQKGTPCPSLWLDIPPLSHAAAERMGYPTQKPLSLLERVIAASSNEGDVVLDPFAGCGTSTHAAQKLGRKWIGIDISELAVTLMKKRLKNSFPDLSFEFKSCHPKSSIKSQDTIVSTTYSSKKRVQVA